MIAFLRGGRWAAVLLVAALLAGCAAQRPVNSPAGMTTTVILIRHGDRVMPLPDLSETGRERAAALPGALAGVPLDAIYSPDLARNLDTVAPLASERGLVVKVIPVEEVARRLVEENPGKSVLWVGNTDNLGQIYADLGGDDVPPVKYGDLYILKVPDQGPTEITKLRFGPEFGGAKSGS